jgi:heme-degrading monooxygenase HmoA
MYARMIQATAKPGQLRECVTALVDRGLPVLKQQQGFVDALALTSDTERDKVVGVTIWRSKEDAEKYVNGQGRQVMEFIRPLLQQEPTVGSFNLEASTTHNINIARAASQR